MAKPLDFTFYNPDQLEDDAFLAGFVARQDLADKILARLGSIKPRNLAHHRLIVGQRGMGKTSLLRRIAIGVRDHSELAAILLPLSFREEQYNVHNLHVFWCNCLDALGDWFETIGRRADAERLDREVAALNTQEDDEEGSKALALFGRWMKEEQRRPLLLLDNLDIIFAGLKSKQWSLRRVLQEAGGVVVIGTSAAALEAAANREGAFYDFFQVDVLAKLEHYEILLCLRHMARQREEAGRKVLQILDRDPARIHVLYDLTGGNPRTLALLYLVLETSGDDGVMRDLERLLDQATPLYKARVEELAPQARVVFDALALAWDPATAADLANVTGLDIGVVSTQLDRLSKDGVVEKTTRSSTTRTAFQVAERFFNIWYLMRHSSRRQRLRLRWLTEMLRRIYSPQELRERATGLLGGAASKHARSAAYYFALCEAIEDRELRVALRSSARRQSLFAAEDLQVEDDLSQSHLVPQPTDKGESAASCDFHLETYRKAIDCDPRDSGLWNGLGKLLLDLPESNAEAELAFRKAIEIDSEYAAPWTNLGDLLTDPLGRYEEAEAAYRKSIGIDPNDTRPWTNLGDLLTDSLERHEEAEAAYRKAIEIDPKEARPWTNLGDLLAGPLERYEEAETAYRKAIAVDSKDARPWTNLGDLLARPLERYEEAEAAYRKAIEIEPNSMWPWAGLGRLLTDSLKRHAEAEVAFRKALEFSPKSAWPWTRLGMLLASPLERYTEAEAVYRQIIELHPMDAWTWDNLGDLLAGPLERYDEAEIAYRKAIEIEPNNAWYWNDLGMLLAGPLERHAEAEVTYRKAIEIDPKEAWPWSNLGRLLEHSLGRFSEAESAYRRALELDPDDAEAWNNLGLLLEEPFGRSSEAEASYRKAIEIDPSNAWSWSYLGELLAKALDRHVEAEAAFRKALECDPNNAGPWIGLGNLLADHLYRFEEAERAYRAAMEIDPEHPAGPVNLAYLLLRDNRAEAEATYQEALAIVPSYGAGLLRAFHALAANNFGTAITELRAVFEEDHPSLFATFRISLLRILQFGDERGLGNKLLDWLKSGDFGDRYWPLHVAYDAYLHGEERLMDVNPEVRSGARRLLSEMTRRPREPLQPEPKQKPRRKKRAS